MASAVMHSGPGNLVPGQQVEGPRYGSRCSCCPYGYHIDLDFLRFLDSLYSGDSLRNLRRIRHSRIGLNQSGDGFFSDDELSRWRMLSISPIQSPPPRSTSSCSHVTTDDILMEIDTSMSRTLHTIDEVDTRVIRKKKTPRSTLERHDVENGYKSPPPIQEQFQQQVQLQQQAEQQPVVQHHLEYQDQNYYKQNSTAEVQTTLTSTELADRFTGLMASTPMSTTGSEQSDVEIGGVISPMVLQAIREQMATSLQRMRELEEQVRIIPTMEDEISSLREENRRLYKLLGKLSDLDRAKVADGNRFAIDGDENVRTFHGDEGSVLVELPVLVGNKQMRSIGVGDNDVHGRPDLSHSYLTRTSETSTSRMMSKEVRSEIRELNASARRAFLYGGQESESSSGELPGWSAGRIAPKASRTVGVGDGNVFESFQRPATRDVGVLYRSGHKDESVTAVDRDERISGARVDLTVTVSSEERRVFEPRWEVERFGTGQYQSVAVQCLIIGGFLCHKVRNPGETADDDLMETAAPGNEFTALMRTTTSSANASHLLSVGTTETDIPCDLLIEEPVAQEPLLSAFAIERATANWEAKLEELCKREQQHCDENVIEETVVVPVHAAPPACDLDTSFRKLQGMEDKERCVKEEPIVPTAAVRKMCTVDLGCLGKNDTTACTGITQPDILNGDISCGGQTHAGDVWVETLTEVKEVALSRELEKDLTIAQEADVQPFPPLLTAIKASSLSDSDDAGDGLSTVMQQLPDEHMNATDIRGAENVTVIQQSSSSVTTSVSKQSTTAMQVTVVERTVVVTSGGNSGVTTGVVPFSDSSLVESEVQPTPSSTVTNDVSGVERTVTVTSGDESGVTTYAVPFSDLAFVESQVPLQPSATVTNDVTVVEQTVMVTSGGNFDVTTNWPLAESEAPLAPSSTVTNDVTVVERTVTVTGGDETGVITNVIPFSDSALVESEVSLAPSATVTKDVTVVEQTATVTSCGNSVVTADVVPLGDLPLVESEAQLAPSSTVTHDVTVVERTVTVTSDGESGVTATAVPSIDSALVESEVAGSATVSSDLVLSTSEPVEDTVTAFPMVRTADSFVLTNIMIDTQEEGADTMLLLVDAVTDAQLSVAPEAETAESEEHFYESSEITDSAVTGDTVIVQETSVDDTTTSSADIPTSDNICSQYTTGDATEIYSINDDATAGSILQTDAAIVSLKTTEKVNLEGEVEGEVIASSDEVILQSDESSKHEVSICLPSLPADVSELQSSIREGEVAAVTSHRVTSTEQVGSNHDFGGVKGCRIIITETRIERQRIDGNTEHSESVCVTQNSNIENLVSDRDRQQLDMTHEDLLRKPEEAYDVSAEQSAFTFEYTQELSEEMLKACNVYAQWLVDPLSVLPGDKQSSIETIQKHWFHTAGRKSSNPADVRNTLGALERIHLPLMFAVVNLADVDGNTALHYAVSHCNISVMEALLDSRVCDVMCQNRAGYTPIMLASLLITDVETHKDAIKRLFEAGDVNVKSETSGQTALMLASSHGRQDMVQQLLASRADVNARDEDGSTALMCACEHGYIEIVQMLLGDPACDSTLADVDGSTALSIAMEEGHRDIGVLLYAHMNAGRHGSQAEEQQPEDVS